MAVLCCQYSALRRSLPGFDSSTRAHTVVIVHGDTSLSTVQKRDGIFLFGSMMAELTVFVLACMHARMGAAEGSSEAVTLGTTPAQY